MRFQARRYILLPRKREPQPPLFVCQVSSPPPGPTGTAAFLWSRPAPRVSSRSAQTRTGQQSKASRPVVDIPISSRLPVPLGAGDGQPSGYERLFPKDRYVVGEASVTPIEFQASGTSPCADRRDTRPPIPNRREPGPPI